MREQRAKFANRWWLLGAALLSAATLVLLLRLGVWQLQRAQFKEALAGQAQENATRQPILAHQILEQAGDNESWYFRPVRGLGRFDPERQYLLDNRTFDARAGYHIFSVFKYGTQYLLVNRGWAPVGPDRRVLPDVRIDDRQVVVTGLLAPLPGGGLLLGDSGYGQASWPKVVQRVELERMERQLGHSLLPAVLLLDPKHGACLRCRWAAARGISAERHRGYAVQWFSLAAALIVLLGAVSFMRARRTSV